MKILQTTQKWQKGQNNAKKDFDWLNCNQDKKMQECQYWATEPKSQHGQNNKIKAKQTTTKRAKVANLADC